MLSFRASLPFSDIIEIKLTEEECVKLSVFQNITTKNELDRLLRYFLKKREEDFVFRGHADFSWELKPKLFRDSEVVKSWESYGLSKKHVAENWIENDNTLITLSYISGSQTLTKNNYKSMLIS